MEKKRHISLSVWPLYIWTVLFVALPLVGMDQNLQYAIKGGIILVACALDMRKYLVKK